MTKDNDLVKRLRMADEYLPLGHDGWEAADRIEELEAERERLALAICGGEDAPGYANAQTVETLEKVTRDNANDMMEQINRTLTVEAQLKGAIAECERIGRLWHDAEAKLAKVKEAFRINMMHALPDYTHEMFDKDYAEMVGEDLG